MAPSIAFNNVQDVNEKNTDTLNFSNSGIGLRYSAGLFGDFHFGKYYAFHTGLWFTVMRTGIQYANTKSGKSGKAIYNTQQLQIPLALKLFTSEIATDMKLYFTLGGNIAAIINEKKLEYSAELDQEPGKGKAFGIAEVGLLVGAGIEYQMAESTTLFGGFVYNRGLFDPTSKAGLFSKFGDGSDLYKLNNQLIGLEMGIKF